jgi:hypothetical protein
MTLLVFLVAFAIFCVRNNSGYWLLVLPGTIVHESLHYVTGKLLFAGPQTFNIVPQHHENGTCYGSVDFDNLNEFNAPPTALAPLLGIPLVYYVWPYLQTTQNGWAQIAIIWALAAIVAQSWPSETDWAVALKHPLGLVLWAGFVGWILL